MDISKKSFLSAVVILLVLLIAAGFLTQVIPMGQYDYQIVEGKEVLIADSYHAFDGDRLPVYKWFTAPFDVLFADGSVIIIMIIIFLMIIGGAIHLLNETHVLSTLIQSIIDRFENKKKILIYMITFIFMSMGALVGIFEEVVPLVPLMIALSIALGYDLMMGLGMSVLATGLGFAAAISNPFTIGVAQQLSGVTMFSGAGYRVIIFVCTYIILNIFLSLYGKRIYKAPSTIDQFHVKGEKAAVLFFLVVIGLLGIMIALTPFVPLISSYNLPLIALLFLVAGIGCGLLSKEGIINTLTIMFKGSVNMLPAVILILIASGIKHLIQSGMIMDTILHEVSGLITNNPPFVSVVIVYLLVLFLNFFIGSGSAKAFIVMPIIAPLMDMVGISRQMGILAFQFGDGFSNILYPTNAVLLIALGLAGVSYGKWFKWILKLQLVLVFMSLVFLAIGLLIRY